MSNETDLNAIQIGEILPIGGIVRKTHLTYDTPISSPLSIIILDNEGRTHWNRQFDLPAGKGELELDLSGLKKGFYNAWIEVNGKTFIRNLSIESEETGGFFSMLKSWLN